eukprot:6200190-Pyramimonas_sp.AAC.1
MPRTFVPELAARFNKLPPLQARRREGGILLQQQHALQLRSGHADLTASPGPATSRFFQSDQGLVGPTCFWDPPCEPHHLEGPAAEPLVPPPH